MYYTRLCKDLSDRGILIPTEEVQKYISDYNKDHYTSIHEYNEIQYNHFKEHNSVAGIIDLNTNKIPFDFDSKNDLELARKDALNTIKNIQALGIKESAIQIYFSGLKGFTVVVETNLRITPKQLSQLCLETLAKDVTTLDKSLYNAARILRVPYTKHNVSGLYKIPLSLKELQEKPLEAIKQQATSLDNVGNFEYTTATLPENILPKAKGKEERFVREPDSSFLDLTLKPSYLSNCKYAILHGHFTEGFRDLAMLYLGATYKNQGFPLEVTYRILKGVAELQARKHNCDKYSDEDIYNQIIAQIYGPNWKGGQGSCRPGTQTQGLRDYCQSLGQYACKHEEKSDGATYIYELNDNFKSFIKNIDKNTVKTGIPELDETIFLSTGSNIGLVGASSSGKTSLTLDILKYQGQVNTKTVFASFDMSRTRIYEKLLYKVSGLSRKELYALYGSNSPKQKELENKVKEQYGSIFIMNKTCPSVNDLREYILDCNARSGEKVKLVVIDYFERIMSEYSDDTQASKKIAGELQDLIEDLGVCVITLVQPNKNALSGGISSAIYDFTKIKGSSFIYQSFRQIISIWRPGYSPENNMMDKFMRISVIKNDLGDLANLAFKWNGKKGEISSLNDEDYLALQELEARQREARGNMFGRFQ